MPSSYSSPMGSYRRRARPRPGLVNRIIYILKRIFTDAIRYVRQNPTKIILPVVMALVSGGGLAAMAKKFGVKLPAAFGAGGGLGRGLQSGFNAHSSFGAGAEEGGGMLRNVIKVASAFM